MTNAAETPARRQYLEVKRRFPHAIVFFRLGDFYETFDDDAVLVARELEIVLTSKPIGKGQRVPLAGFPFHSLQTHTKKLVSRGYKVAVCEQVEDPKKAKGIVQREVVRVITPGTVVEEELLSASANNYLVAVAPGKGSRNGLAYVDVTTGEFCAAEVSDADLVVELARLGPAELLLPDGVELPGLPVPEAARSLLDPRLFGLEEAEARLKQHFHVASLEGYGLRGLPLATSAAGAVLAYLGDNQRAALSNVKDLDVYNPTRFMVMDASARRHLEVLVSQREGTKRGSLVDCIDATRTAMGSRLLGRWLGQPLLDITTISQRLDRVERFHADAIRRTQTREKLRDLPDVERIAGRIAVEAATPRDLAALRRALASYPELLTVAGEEGSVADKDAASECLALLEASIAEDPAPTVGNGGVIRQGFSPELDEARALTGDVRRALADLEAEERERSGIRSLRVAYNRVFGYYIEISKANLALAPADFQRKQTLVGAERFVTPRLKELEERILGARETIGELEASLFRRVVAQLAGLREALQRIARTLAELDVYSALAETASRCGYVRPEVDEGEAIEIVDGRHPVVERGLGDGRFVPNDTLLSCDEAQIVVLTGPNMAGKSTYLRQVALIVLLAQCGSFVPARSARIGVVDRVFTRIGAQDDLSRGESTFMVEMLETAAILRGVTRRSLVLFDEVGRGTSTYDGLAIARAVVEHLHARPERAAKTLFATHYHEMTQLAHSLARVRNQSVAVSEQDGQVVFLHRIVEGGADRSYGIHVAELAGMPRAVIERAREVLQTLEAAGANGSSARKRAESRAQLPLLTPAVAPSELETELAALDVDELSPREALAKLYELQAKARGA